MGEPPQAEQARREADRAERAPGEPERFEPDSQPLDGRLLRPATFQDDDDPRFSWWLPLPGLALAVGWAGYGAVSAEAAGGATFLEQLLWPGAAILVLGTLAAFLGWRLDID